MNTIQPNIIRTYYYNHIFILNLNEILSSHSLKFENWLACKCANSRLMNKQKQKMDRLMNKQKQKMEDKKNAWWHSTHATSCMTIICFLLRSWSRVYIFGGWKKFGGGRIRRIQRNSAKFGQNLGEFTFVAVWNSENRIFRISAAFTENSAAFTDLPANFPTFKFEFFEYF